MSVSVKSRLTSFAARRFACLPTSPQKGLRMFRLVGMYKALIAARSVCARAGSSCGVLPPPVSCRNAASGAGYMGPPHRQRAGSDSSASRLLETPR